MSAADAEPVADGDGAMEDPSERHAQIEALIARHGLNRLELSDHQIEQLRRLFSSAE